MELNHRLALAIDRKIQAELADLGIRVPLGFVGFDVLESANSWPSLEAWIRRRQPSDVVWAKFSDEEIGRASWVALLADAQGYPQPHDDDFGYLEATFDLSEYCRNCGFGLRQKAAFQMKGEPSWGRRGIMQLNWVYDEFFVKPDVHAAVFKPLGIDSRPVTNRLGRTLETVVQLVVDELVPVDTSGLTGARCAVCGRVKFPPSSRGMIPPALRQPSHSMAKTVEYFGSGGSAYREVLASRDSRDAMTSAAVRGASFIPVAEADHYEMDHPGPPD